MSEYRALYRTYRPQRFSDVVGQGHVTDTLANEVQQGRVAHAYLFAGPRGTGKTSTARILAKSLNCLGVDGQGGITAEPCGVCQACTDIDSGRFVDYTELDAASNRGVDEVQSLLEQAVYKPVQGRFKVFMIDEVHMNDPGPLPSTMASRRGKCMPLSVSTSLIIGVSRRVCSLACSSWRSITTSPTLNATEHASEDVSIASKFTQQLPCVRALQEKMRHQ